MKVENKTPVQSQTFTVTLTPEEIRSVAHVHALLGAMGQTIRQERDQLRNIVAMSPFISPETEQHLNDLGFTLDKIRAVAPLLDLLVPLSVVGEAERGEIAAKVIGTADL